MIREVSTDEPCGLGMVGEASIIVILLFGCRSERDKAVDTVIH